MEGLLIAYVPEKERRANYYYNSKDSPVFILFFKHVPLKQAQ